MPSRKDAAPRVQRPSRGTRVRRGSALDAVLKPPKVDPRRAGFFRFRRLGRKVLVTNDTGQHALLAPKQFSRFVEGGLEPGEKLHDELCAKGFIRDYMDFDRMVAEWRKRNCFLWQGPQLHIVVVTLRCDHRCVYCQTSSVKMDRAGFDMSRATARKVVDAAFGTPSPSLTIEFQGGEPLANWPAVRLITERARELEKRTGKKLWLTLVTNLSLMDDEKLDFLLLGGVNICTSIDGPAKVHDANRVYGGGGVHRGAAPSRGPSGKAFGPRGSSHELVTRWWAKIRKRTRGKTFGIDALMTTTRLSLGDPRGIVDEYVRLGARGMYLRPLSPYGFAGRTWEAVGYDTGEFLDFYRRCLDYILDLNVKGTRFFEQTFRILGSKVLRNEEPNFLDLRSPCGAGIGQLAYNHDGKVYTCDEGRMVSRMGDESFRLGDLATDGYRDIVSHPTVRALATASCLENQAECAGCAYLPYCGICPVENYVRQGDLFPRTPTSERCRLFKGIFDYFFEKIQDRKIKRIVGSWTRVPTNLYQRD